jgi:hypothetical protein
MTIDRAIEFAKLECSLLENFPIEEIKEYRDLIVLALQFMKQFENTSTCNTCSIRDLCKYTPPWGEQVRYNCPHYKGE